MTITVQKHSTGSSDSWCSQQRHLCTFSVFPLMEHDPAWELTFNDDGSFTYEPDNVL